MSSNIDQIYTANPITSNTGTDLMYFGQSPYGTGNDAAMTFTNFSAQFANKGANTNITSMTGLTGTLDAPTGINNPIGTPLLIFSGTTSSSGTVTFSNADHQTLIMTGSAGIGLYASGVGNIYLRTAGSSFLSIKDTSASAIVNFYNQNGSYVGLTVSSSQVGSVTFTLPTADGSSGQFLGTDGAGHLSFSTVTSGANFPVNTNITSMTGLTGALQAPTAIEDSSGNRLLVLDYQASSVNYWVLFNSATTTPLFLEAQGSDSSINITIASKGETSSIFLSATHTIAQFESEVNAVNYIIIENAESGGFPSIYATGSDSNISLNVITKAGNIILEDITETIAPAMIFYNAIHNQYTGIKAGVGASSNIVFSLPVADGSSGQAITTNGSAVLSFSTVADAPINTTIISMTGLTGALKAPTSILDPNSNLIISFGHNASAVNYINFINNSTNNPCAISAQGADTNITLELLGKGTGGAAIKGTGTNDNAAAGYVGEFISSVIVSGSSVTCNNATATDVTSISLTAGDWDVYGNVLGVALQASTQALTVWTSATSATIPATPLYNNFALATGTLNATAGISVPYARYSLSTTTTIYLSCEVSATSGTSTVCGAIYARRAR
jgi:hypothetical protein